MVEQWIGLTNLPAHGREFSFDDQGVWRELWKEFHCELDVAVPLASTLSIVPQPDGFLIQGRIAGAVKAMCHRCLEDAQVAIDHAFDTFEAHEDAEAPEGEEGHLRASDAGWELNVAGLLWEEFLLAMPEKILCADTCLGLCPHCGKNRNLEHCACCNLDDQSPLARALQGVKIKTN
jgi:uncharacterized protein